MFKSFFRKSPEDIIHIVVDIAFKERNFISKLYEPLSMDGQIELFIFNIIYSWLYIQDNSLFDMTSTNAELFTIVGGVKANSLKSSLEIDEYYNLFRDRYVSYSNELKLVNENQFTGHEYFPENFYSRLYNYPLILTAIEDNEFLENEFYSKELLIDIYKHQINELQKELDLNFKT